MMSRASTLQSVPQRRTGLRFVEEPLNPNTYIIRWRNKDIGEVDLEEGIALYDPRYIRLQDLRRYLLERQGIDPDELEIFEEDY
jgi:Fe-S-cluster formation regulator IscX/YfhJ